MINLNTIHKHLAAYSAELLPLAQKALPGPIINQLMKRLPDVTPSVKQLDRSQIIIGKQGNISPEQHRQLMQLLIELKPWRKGPFRLFGIDIQSEWDSSLKWDRVQPHLNPIAGRKILDAGCSNGYYLFRMAASNPAMVLGIDPYQRYLLQYYALQKYLKLKNVCALPLKLEDLAPVSKLFDTVFCMGIVYHRRSPLDCLNHLHSLLVPGGQLVLETLIIESDREIALFPRQRYAAMRNVYFIPSLSCLTSWLKRCGFHNIRCIDTSPTTLNEQRKTAWIDSDSLDTFLDPNDPGKTIEGYPAPVRAIFLAEPKPV
ncbi:MAG: tRNA 5-methoxyuridine(34)/uridine 5-oxyacetic acid(34) synthase CmoB [Desulfobacteraceae bacterium]|nr:tRNA 5-methoxyuridine(34)/uridine 5-oxyacetic acid(34) synthase CmoB [Desulfobacteraceae bacterium]